MLTIEEILRTQRAFNQGKFVDYVSATPAERQALTKDYVLHMLDETHEVLRCVSWKMHKKREVPVDEFELKVELIDMLKFWGNFAALWDMGPEEAAELFAKKSKIVEGRFSIGQLQPASGPLVIIGADAFMLFNDDVLDNMAVIFDRYDCEFIIDNSMGVLDSRGKFEAEYQTIGLLQIRCSISDEPRGAFNDVKLSLSCGRPCVRLSFGKALTYNDIQSAMSAMSQELKSRLEELLK